MRASRVTGIDFELPPPPELEAQTFALGPDEYAILTFRLPALALPPGLTPVERELARDLIAGLKPLEIANKRQRSISTVRNQIRAIYGKTGVGSLVEFIGRCRREA